jgi:ATP-dependent RNA helicase RhlE
MQKFEELSLPSALLSNLAAIGYDTPTPIQAQSIPYLLEGHDLLGIAQTGTGKTAAFSLPIINYLLKNPKTLKPGIPRVLILAPTRELATQINESIQMYAKGLKLKSAVIFGGVGQAAQVTNLRGGLDILVATPGRLLDLMDQRHLRLSDIEIFVLDEADRMLDMGFIHDIKKVIAVLPPKKQTLLFSATMPNEIASLANKLLHQPKRVEVTPPSTTVERIEQRVILCRKADKYQLLRKVLAKEDVEMTLVFTRTKHGANKVVDYLAHFKIPSAAIHGNKSQSAREKALEDFKNGTIKVLVATDIAARGIDVQGISHVVNYDLPMEPESYVHRIGRTARAGKEGDAISFCDETERDLLSRIQKLIKLKLPTEEYIAEQEDVSINKIHKEFKDSRRQTQHGRRPRPEQRPHQPGGRRPADTRPPRREQPAARQESGDAQPSWEAQREQMDKRIDQSRNARPRFQRPRRDNPGQEPEGNRNENGPQKKVGYKFRKRR